MPFVILFLLIFGLAVVGWIAARARALQLGRAQDGRPHSRPGHHGSYVALWLALPALLFLTVWSIVTPGLVEQSVLASPVAEILPEEGIQRTAILSEAEALANGTMAAAFNEEARALVPAFREAAGFYRLIGIAATLILAFAGGA